MDDFGGTPIFGTPYIVVNQLYQYYKSWADIGWVERLAGTNHRTDRHAPNNKRSPIINYKTGRWNKQSRVGGGKGNHGVSTFQTGSVLLIQRDQDGSDMIILVSASVIHGII